MIRWELTTAVTSGYDENGFIGIQPAALGQSNGADAGMGPYQMVQPLGYYARPLDRDASGVGCWTLSAIEGGKGYAWCIQDPRYARKAPPLSKGSRAIVADDGAFILMDCDTETTTIYRPNKDGSKAHIVTIGKDSNGAETLELRHSSGAYVSATDSGIVVRGTGNGYLEVNGDKLNANGNFNCPGAGSFGGGVSPLNSLVTNIGFQLFVSTLLSQLGAMTSPTLPPQALAGAISAALAAAQAALPTKFLSSV